MSYEIEAQAIARITNVLKRLDDESRGRVIEWFTTARNDRGKLPPPPKKSRRKGGRPPVPPDDPDVLEAKRLSKDGHSSHDVAEIMGIPKSTAWRWINK